MTAPKKTPRDIELEPDAWQRFERAVTVVGKTPPQDREKGEAEAREECICAYASGEEKMNKTTKEKWTFRLALFGAGSPLSIVFSFFQWWSSEQKNRISAAIDLSKMYLSDREMNSRYLLLFNYEPGAKRDGEEYLRERAYVDFLNYVAHLANEGNMTTGISLGASNVIFGTLLM